MATIFTILFDNLYIASTTLTVSGGTATIKNASTGVTVDTQTVMASSSTITSANLAFATAYTVTFSGANGVPAGTYTFNTNLQDYYYVVSIPEPYGISTTTSPPTAALPSPNPAIQTAWISFFNTSTGTTLPAGLTTTITVSGVAGTVDTQVTNAQGQISSTKILEAPIYTCTFTGTGAPTGTYTMYITGNVLNNVII